MLPGAGPSQVAPTATQAEYSQSAATLGVLRSHGAHGVNKPPASLTPVSVSGPTPYMIASAQ